MLNSLSPGALGVAFHAHPLKGTLRSYQPIFPLNDGTFPTVQLPLPGKELHP
jgi:hypothetical protein